MTRGQIELGGKSPWWPKLETIGAGQSVTGGSCDRQRRRRSVPRLGQREFAARKFTSSVLSETAATAAVSPDAIPCLWPRRLRPGHPSRWFRARGPGSRGSLLGGPVSRSTYPSARLLVRSTEARTTITGCGHGDSDAPSERMPSGPASGPAGPPRAPCRRPIPSL